LAGVPFEGTFANIIKEIEQMRGTIKPTCGNQSLELCPFFTEIGGSQHGD